ncbi:hemagglutinin/amebocyte aggregation factor-like [Sardina pilchardus]|uniref:hemagglutinin/amebocyte aggregation factor-like n=1 Tax=Sardina pilchardus TaxID=27697 RepID=UPI002E0EC8CD
MKFFIVCSFVLLMGMAVTTSAKALAPTTSTDEGMDREKMNQIIEKLASRPEYEGPYEVPGVMADDPLAPALTNDTDGSNGEGKRDKRWANSFDGSVYFICPYYESISRISSYHSDAYEDRRFSISCKRTFNSFPTCQQSGWVNSLDRYFAYTCPTNYVLAGMESYHNDNYEDRRFGFRCCAASGHRHSYCYWTEYVNWFDQYFEYSTNSRSFLAGVSSYHDNNAEDRRFRFYVCIN